MQRKNEWKKIKLFNMDFYVDYHTWETEKGIKQIEIISLSNVQSGIKTRFDNGFMLYKDKYIPIMQYVGLLLGFSPVKEEVKEEVKKEEVKEEIKEEIKEKVKPKKNKNK